MGGGLEPEDPDIEAALHREVFEEIGGKVDQVRQIFLVTDCLTEGVGLQHVFAARLCSMDLARRTGIEFIKPGEIQRAAWRDSGWDTYKYTYRHLVRLRRMDTTPKNVQSQIQNVLKDLLDLGPPAPDTSRSSYSRRRLGKWP